MERKVLISLILLVSINVMDSLIGCVVGPTLIFYLRSIGGDNDDYGRIQSLGALAALIMSPVYGKWVDSNGSKYQAPYAMSFGLGMADGLLYFGAVLLPAGPIAIAALYLSVMIGGAGKASRSLAYTWIASGIPLDEQRTILTFLSMGRTFGNVVGPLLNVLVAENDTELTIGGMTVPLTPYNSIGLMVFVGELVLALATAFFLIDPQLTGQSKGGIVEDTPASGSSKLLHALGHFDIFFPVFLMFVVVFAYNLIGVSFSPVASTIGWTPVDISEYTAIKSVLMAIAMILSMGFSVRKDVSDVALISFGLTGFIISTALMYLFWMTDVTYWGMTLPGFICMVSYPFIGPANRSNFTRAIHNRKELEGYHGIMMSMYTQSVMLASLVGPTFVGSYVVRTPEDVAMGTNEHLLNDNALVFPALCVLTLTGMLCERGFRGEPPDASEPDTEHARVSEVTSLIERSDAKTQPRRSSMTEIRDSLSHYAETQNLMAAECRLSMEFNGIVNPFETKYEMELKESFRKDQKEWEALSQVSEVDEEE